MARKCYKPEQIVNLPPQAEIPHGPGPVDGGRGPSARDQRGHVSYRQDRLAPRPHPPGCKPLLSHLGPVAFPGLGIAQVEWLAVSREFAGDALPLERVAVGVEDGRTSWSAVLNLKALGWPGSMMNLPPWYKCDFLTVSAESFLPEMGGAVTDEEPHGPERMGRRWLPS